MSVDMVDIVDGDDISRLVFKPKDFFNGVGPLCLDKSLFFQSRDNYKESVNCNRLVGEFPEDLHKQGIDKASNDTEKRAKEDKPPVTYEGFCEIRAQIVRNVNEDGHKFEVAHSPTNDNAAHCDIQLLFSGKKPMPAQRNLAIKKLSESFSDVIPFKI